MGSGTCILLYFSFYSFGSSTFQCAKVFFVLVAGCQHFVFVIRKKSCLGFCLGM